MQLCECSFPCVIFKAPDAFAISRYEEVMISMENEIIELLRASFLIDIVVMFFLL